MNVELLIEVKVAEEAEYLEKVYPNATLSTAKLT
jgi:hypothetical protein